MMQEANKRLFKAYEAENQKLQGVILSKFEKALEATSGRLQEIYESVNKRITGIEERVSHLEKATDTKVHDLEKTVGGKFQMINNLQIPIRDSSQQKRMGR